MPSLLFSIYFSFPLVLLSLHAVQCSISTKSMGHGLKAILSKGYWLLIPIPNWKWHDCAHAGYSQSTEQTLENKKLASNENQHENSIRIVSIIFVLFFKYFAQKERHSAVSGIFRFCSAAISWLNFYLWMYEFVLFPFILPAFVEQQRNVHSRRRVYFIKWKIE